MSYQTIEQKLEQEKPILRELVKASMDANRQGYNLAIKYQSDASVSEPYVS